MYKITIVGLMAAICFTASFAEPAYYIGGAPTMDYVQTDYYNQQPNNVPVNYVYNMVAPTPRPRKNLFDRLLGTAGSLLAIPAGAASGLAGAGVGALSGALQGDATAGMMEGSKAGVLATSNLSQGVANIFG